MTVQDLAGYIAASLVFATFCAKGMVPLRVLGVASNIAFVSYASIAGLWPILILHSILLPLNIVRLRQALFGRPLPDVNDGADRQRRQIAVIAANDNAQENLRDIGLRLATFA